MAETEGARVFVQGIENSYLSTLQFLSPPQSPHYRKPNGTEHLRDSTMRPDNYWPPAQRSRLR